MYFASINTLTFSLSLNEITYPLILCDSTSLLSLLLVKHFPIYLLWTINRNTIRYYLEFASGIFYLGCCFNVHVNYGLNQYVISFMAVCVLVYIVVTLHDSLSNGLWVVSTGLLLVLLCSFMFFFYAYTHTHTHCCSGSL